MSRRIPTYDTPTPDGSIQNERAYRESVQRVLVQLASNVGTELPDVSSIVATFTYDGKAKVTVTGNEYVKSIRCAISTTAYPSTATVEATTAVNGRTADFTFNGPYAIGDTVYLSAIAYSGLDASGLLSPKKDALFTVSVLQPTLLVDIVQTASTGFFDPGAGVNPTATLTVTVTDPTGKLTGNALVTPTSNSLQNLEYWDGGSWVAAVPVNQTLGAAYTYRATLYKALGGGAYAKWTATKTGGYKGIGTWWASSAWADMDADVILTVGNNQDETDLTAKVSMIVNTRTDAHAIKWKASLTDYPTQADTESTGTRVPTLGAGGSPFFVSDLGLTLNLSETVYVTVVLYDQFDQKMDKAFKAKATRTNLSRTKTAQWAAAGNFHPYSIESKVPAGTIVRLSNEVVLDRSLDELAVNWVGPGTGLILYTPETGRANHSFILPDGCTVTDFNAEVWDDTDTDSTVVCNVYVKCADVGSAIGDASLIAELDGTQTGGWQDLTVTGLDQDTTNKRFVAYCIMGHATEELKGTSNLYTKFRSFSVTYLPDNLQATL